MLSHTVHIRFYGQLADFLAPALRGRCFSYIIKGQASIKDTLEAVGVPHVAIDVIFVNRISRDFSYQVKEGDEIRVYPEYYPLRNKEAVHLLTSPPALRFVVDSHLGKLARRLRLLGFDTLYKTVFPDKDIVFLACRQRRIALTRDKGLLKHRSLRWGYWVRSIDALWQIREVVKKYRLARNLRPFSRCMECNGLLENVAKARITDQLPLKTRLYYKRFYRCKRCRHIYWKGSHYARLNDFIAHLRSQYRQRTTF
jgi:hypothetical protein